MSKHQALNLYVSYKIYDYIEYCNGKHKQLHKIECLFNCLFAALFIKGGTDKAAQDCTQNHKGRY